MQVKTLYLFDSEDKDLILKDYGEDPCLKCPPIDRDGCVGCPESRTYNKKLEAVCNANVQEYQACYATILVKARLLSQVQQELRKLYKELEQVNITPEEIDAAVARDF